MLIQCDYGNGEFFVRNQTIYYQGVKVSPVNPAPVMTVGGDELYIFQAVFPLNRICDCICHWLVVIQSCYPSFYEANKIETMDERVIVTLTNGKQIKITPFRDGACDRLLVNEVYRI